MADVEVKGMAELARNLAAFGDDKIVGRIIKSAMQAGARIARPRAASNARALGLGRQGIVRRADRPGNVKRYGRIPRALKVGRTYIPRGQPNLYRCNVVARGQNMQGIYKNKAPHAHLIEYGFNHRGGTRVAGRPFMGPALEVTAQQVVEKIATTMARRIDELRFPT